MVFATHKNWKEYADNASPKAGEMPGLKQQLDELKAKKLEADEALRKLQAQLAMEQAARKQALAALAQRATKAEMELGLKEAELATLTTNHTQVSAAAKTAQDRLTTLEGEITGLRGDLRTTQQDLDKQFQQVVDLTESLNQAMGLQKELQERNQQAVLQIAQMKMVMDAHGLKPDTLVAHIPPKVEAVVLEVSDKDLIEISIGSDDGIKIGHALEVFRDNTYLGRIIIKKTAPDRAVGQIQKDLQRGQIKRGDRVTTKLS
jgi:chromosome segregation ATPase